MEVITLPAPPTIQPNQPDDEQKRSAPNVDQILAEAIETWQRSGELGRLRGRPLDLGDDTSEWLVNRFLKQAGYSHPLLEQGQELDARRQEVDRPLARLRRRRERLAGQPVRLTPWQIHEFNEQRRQALEEYREALTAFNRAIRDYNLGVPTPLQRRLLDVSSAVAAAAEDIAPLEMPSPPQRRPIGPSWRALRHRWRSRRQDTIPQEPTDRAG